MDERDMADIEKQGEAEAHEQAQAEAEAYTVGGHPIDTKYTFTAFNNQTNKLIDDAEGFLFLAKDNAVPATLRFYYKECERLGASKEQLAGIHGLILRVEKYREMNPDLCKVPD